MTGRVRQVQVTAPRRAELVDVPLPAKPLGAGEVQGRTLATVISAGTELASAYTAEGGFPRRPGYAAVFEVEAVGAEVTSLRPGQRAFCLGGHASFQRHPAEDVVAVPEGLDPRVAVLARLMGVSWTTLVTTSARPPAPVLVTGLGLVGHLAAKVFAAAGYPVFAVDPDERRRDLLAADGCCDVGEAVPTLDRPEAALAGFALVVECSGHEQAVLDGCRAVRKGGEVVLVGVPWRRRTDLPAFDVLHAVFHRYAVLRGGWEWELPPRRQEFRRGSIFESFAGALRWLAEGRVRASGLCTPLPPAECDRAYQDLLHGRCERLSYVFDWTA